jgi:glutathione S-transferase
VLAAVEELAAGGAFLVGRSLSLADLHLGAMAAYFAMAEEGRAELARHRRLCEWWSAFSAWPSLRRSDPGLPQGASPP